MDKLLLSIFVLFVTICSVDSLSSTSLVADASRSLANRFYDVDLHTMKNLQKIIRLFERERVDSSTFHGVNGYGYGDIGREKFDNIVASLMGAETALVRLQFFSGTHAISTALFSVLRPGDEFLCVSGKPYDTLEEVIGLRPNAQTGTTKGSLMDWGITYHQMDLLSHDNKQCVAKFDLDKVKQLLQTHPKVKLLHIQRSCGYQWRPSLLMEEIERLCQFTRHHFPTRDLVLFCDNCYGELVEDREPCHVGVDLVAGSLIKNLGGTLAPAGGYVAGRRDLVEACAVQLSAPGVEGGATFQQYSKLYQGLFNSPNVIGESLKGAELLSHVMGEQLGYPCNPPSHSYRTDIIQAVQLGSRDKLIAFCEEVQKQSPVGAFIRPVPGKTSGYGDEVIFADGTFIEGSTLELSADGPLRPPFVAYSQGCTHWSHWALILDQLMNRKEFQR